MDWIELAQDRDRWKVLMNFWFPKILGSSWTAGQLAASEEGISPMELVSPIKDLFLQYRSYDDAVCKCMNFGFSWRPPGLQHRVFRRELRAMLPPPSAASLRGLLFDLENKGDLFFRNAGLSPNHVTFQPRRPYGWKILWCRILPRYTFDSPLL
jgi:hypothetical protein